jgi:hypothetical protein
MPLQRVETLATAGGQALLDQLGQGQVDVVAAQEQVIADRDPGKATVGVDGDQREVGGAAADIEHQDPLARRQGAGGAAVAVDPGVERGLGLLEEHDLGEAGLGGGQGGELPGRLVERRRAGHDDVLLGEPGVGEGVIPGRPDVGQDLGLGRHRRQSRPVVATPRQDGGVAIDAGVAQPGLGRGDHPLRVAGALAAGQLADHLATTGVLGPPRQDGGRRRQVVLARQVHEGRELAAGPDLTRGHELRHLEHPDPGVGGGGVDVRDRGVGRAEIDPDQVTGSHGSGCSRRPRPAPATARGKLPGCAAAWAR